MIFYWKAKGTAHDHYNSGEFEADDQAAAEKWVDTTFGVTRDKAGKQTNSDTINASVIDKKEHDELQKVVAQMATDAEKAAKENGTSAA